MSVTPEDILGAARAMSEGGKETDWRNAMSRAYYAAFHKCRAIAREIEVHTDFSTSTAHRDVIDVLRKVGLSGTALAYQLAECGKERRRADYEIGEEVGPEDGRTVVATCAKILARAEHVRGSVPG